MSGMEMVMSERFVKTVELLDCKQHAVEIWEDSTGYEYPVESLSQKVAHSILCAIEVYDNKKFLRWAQDWLSGEDREKESALYAAEVAYADYCEAEGDEVNSAYAAYSAAHAAADVAIANFYAAADIYATNSNSGEKNIATAYGGYEVADNYAADSTNGAKRSVEAAIASMDSGKVTFIEHFVQGVSSSLQLESDQLDNRV